MCGEVQCDGIGWLFQMTNIENSAFKLVLSCGVVSLLHKSKLEARSGLSPACGQCVSLLPTAIYRGYASYFFPLAFPDDVYNAENHS